MTMASPSARPNARLQPVCPRHTLSDAIVRQTLAVVLIALAGCGLESSSSVHGKVTLDGQPVEAGNIAFLPTAASGRKAAAAIEQGAYALSASDKLVPGSYRVEIRWPKSTGRKIPSADPGMQVDETREAIPEKYNTSSTLTVEIAKGDAAKDFALTSN
jgi:hypothetical protein